MSELTGNSARWSRLAAHSSSRGAARLCLTASGNSNAPRGRLLLGLERRRLGR